MQAYKGDALKCCISEETFWEYKFASMETLSVEDINAYSDTFKFHDIINDYLGQEAGDVNVPNLKYYENFAKVVNDKNFGKLKSWMLVKQAASASSFLTDDYRLIFAEYQKSLQGTKEATSKEDAAYNLTTGTFFRCL